MVEGNARVVPKGCDMISMIPDFLLVRLLVIANASARHSSKEAIYRIKDKILRAKGRIVGMDLQEIANPCWWSYWDGCGPKCNRCGGTGVHSRFWVWLQRIEWRGRIFHRPVHRVFVKQNSVSVTINGRIEHAYYGKMGAEACLWLMLVTWHWRDLGLSLTTSRFANPGWWPLLRVQCMAFELRVRADRRRRRIQSRRNGIARDTVDEDVPF